MHEVLVRLTDRPDMTLDVYRARKTTIQQQKKTTVVYEDYKYVEKEVHDH